jgi:tartrate dehydratase alpha subunit/fumarate hydratase class I-like protein
MREIKAEDITRVVAELFLEANFDLTDDVLAAVKQSVQTEEFPVAKEVLGQIIQNAGIAAKEQIPLCQDCGAAVVFLELGQDVHIIGGDLHATVNAGVKKALLRKLGELNPDPEIADLEKELLKRINNLGIGSMGYGGRTTALAVNVEVFPSHLVSMPVAVNLNCHSSRHKEAVI